MYIHTHRHTKTQKCLYQNEAFEDVIYVAEVNILRFRTRTKAYFLGMPLHVVIICFSQLILFSIIVNLVCMKAYNFRMDIILEKEYNAQIITSCVVNTMIRPILGFMDSQRSVNWFCKTTSPTTGREISATNNMPSRLSIYECHPLWYF